MSKNHVQRKLHINSLNESLRILICSFDWRNLYETNIREVFEKLGRDGIAPQYNKIFSVNWSTKGYYKKIDENIETVHMKAPLGRLRFIYDIANIFLAPYLIKKYHFTPDVVIVYDFPSVFSGIGVKFFYGSKIAVIITNIPKKLARTRRFGNVIFLYQTICEFLSKYFIDYAVAISKTTEEYLKEIGIPQQKIRVFSPNVIERDMQYIEASREGVVREKYGIAKNKKIILSVGRLEAEKNFNGLIRALSELQDDKLVLVIVGQGSLREELGKLVRDLNLENQVIFVGNIERKNIWNFYRDADVFILLSKSEGLGLVFWEAMYSGVPVIGPRIEGIAESIGKDGLRGFFWNEGDEISVLKQRIDGCFQKTSDIEDMVLRAKAYVSEKTSFQGGINELLRPKSLS